MDKLIIEQILENNKKSRCCVDELVKPTMDGITIRADNRMRRELAELVKPMTEKKIAELDKLFHLANDALLEIQKFLEA